MTKQFLFLAFCFILTSAWAGDTLVKYSDYTFTIPVEFKKLGKEKRATVQAKHPNWKGIVAYELQGNQHPCWLVFSTDSLRQVKKRTFEERTLELTDALYVNGITHDTLQYDKNVGCVYGKFFENGETRLYGFVFTDFGVIKLFLDHPTGYTSGDEQLFEAIMTSARKELESPKPENNASKQTSTDRHTWQKVSATVLILLVGWMFRKFVLNDKLFRFGRKK